VATLYKLYVIKWIAQGFVSKIALKRGLASIFVLIPVICLVHPAKRWSPSNCSVGIQYLSNVAKSMSHIWELA